MLGKIISSVSGIAQGIINSRTAKRNTDATIAANKAQSEYAYQKDLEMWNRQNEYNNPAAQMQRLKEAGLNPNMVYGSGKATGNTSGTMPKYNVPKTDHNYQPVIQNLPQVLSMYQDFALKNAQIDNEMTQNKILNAEADWRNSLLHNKNLLSGSKADKAYMEKSWMFSPLNEVSTQKGMKSLDYQMDKRREDVRYTGARIGYIQKSGVMLDKKIEHQKMVNQWYTTNLLAKLGIGVGNMVTGSLGKVLRGTKAGMKGPKSIRDYKYNSPSSWNSLPATKMF